MAAWKDRQILKFMQNAVIVLYYFQTVVDVMPITIRTLEGLDLKVQMYKKRKGIQNDKEYRIEVHEKTPDHHSGEKIENTEKQIYGNKRKRNCTGPKETIAETR